MYPDDPRLETSFRSSFGRGGMIAAVANVAQT
jgi:hypothetical protein